MKVATQAVQIPLSGAQWAAKSEAYASLISAHLSADTVWLDAGCGCRLLESDMDPLEDWLAGHCRTIVGMDVSVTSNRNIKLIVQGSLYELPFADNSLDLITCRMVVEHLAQPGAAFAESARCLRPGGALVVITPNLLNYAILGNAVAAKVLPEKLRLRIVHALDSRADEDIFPVRYRANTMPRLVRSLNVSGLHVLETSGLRQQQPYWRKHPSLEKVLMKLTPTHVLLGCAHKVVAKSVSSVAPMPLPIAQSKHLPQNPLDSGTLTG
ncbi:MAG: class I SAM-dependent methyltransferase [Candidatus Sulfotelmatobacter sp.]